MREGTEEYDELVGGIYRAGAGLEPWLDPLNRLARSLQLWAIHFLSVDKTTGRMIFSYEAGRVSPEAMLDYICKYWQVDPRADVGAKLLPGEWFGCSDHFDESYVQASPFYQDFLIAHGGRHLYGGKLCEDERRFVLLGMLRGHGSPPLDEKERELARSIGRHVTRALEIQDHVRKVSERAALGFELLARMRQPILVMDPHRNITFKSASAAGILDRGDILYEDDGVLACRDAESDLDLTLALRDLALVPFNAAAEDARNVQPLERRSLRVRKASSRQVVACTLLALRPSATMGAFGSMPQAMMTIYEPGTSTEIDPFLLATTFDLTPAESRVASAIAAGLTLEGVAQHLKVSISTVRSQLKAIFDKTGTNRQAELVRLLVAATAI